MALQVYTPFTADQSILKGGMAMAEGIGRGLDGLIQGLGKAMEERKRKGDLAKALRKTLSLAYPDQTEDFDAASLPDMQGFLEGKAIQSRVAREARQAKLEEMLLRDREARVQQFKDQAANSAKMPAFLEQFQAAQQPRLESPEPGTEGPANQLPGRAPLEAALEAARSSGFQLPPEMLGSLIKPPGKEFFDRSQFGRGFPIVTPDGKQVPGAFTTPIGPNAAQVVTDPTQPQRPLPERPGDEGMIEIPDPNDPVYGQRIRIPVSVARERYPHLLKQLAPAGSPAPAPAPNPAGGNSPSLFRDKTTGKLWRLRPDGKYEEAK